MDRVKTGRDRAMLMVRSSVHDPVRSGDTMHLTLREHCTVWDARL